MIACSPGSQWPFELVSATCEHLILAAASTVSDEREALEMQGRLRRYSLSRPWHISQE